MYIHLQTSHQVVTLPDDFLTLKQIDGEDLVFELKYLFDQEVGIKQGITSVSVEIAKNSPPKFASDDPNIVRGIQQQKGIHTRRITNYIKNDLVTTVASDPTKNVNNEIVPLYKRGFNSTQIPQLFSRRLKAVRLQDAKNPITLVNAQHDVGEESSEQKIAEELLMLGADPSMSYEENDLGLSLNESHNGTHRASPSVFTTKVQKTLYKYKMLPHLKPIEQTSPGEVGVVIFDDSATPDQFVTERVTVDGRHAEVKDKIRFTLPATSPDRLTLILKAKDSSGVTMQILERVFHPREYIKYFSIPTIAPIVKLSNQTDKTYGMLSIKQVDPVATHVRVYKRVYDHFTVNDEQYTLVNEFDLVPSNGWKYIPVEISLGNTNIYRVVPLSALGIHGSDFATIVVKPKMRNPAIKRVVVTTKPQLQSVLLEVSKLPSDCVSFQMLREDVTLDKGTRVFVETPVRTESNDPNHVYTLTDIGVKQNHVYAYHCRIFRKTGSHEDRLATHYEHVALVENVVETKIVDTMLQLTNSGYDVQFTISTTVVSTNVDQIKQMLERQGLYEIFKDDVADVRDQLAKLIAHNVKRVDLTTGDVEDFGTVTADKFSDLTSRNVTGVSELRLGHKYRYIVTALLRTPETLLESFIKTSRDTITGRDYSYSPFKFLHPVVAKYGNIVTPSSIRTNYSKDPMTFGEIGNHTTVEIALDKQNSIITSATRVKKGSDVDVLQWVLVGPSKDVDHFQIVVEHGGKKTTVGKATCVPETDNFLYVRRLDQTEVGLDLKYYVCPVYHDYVRGREILVANTEGSS